MNLVSLLACFGYVGENISKGGDSLSYLPKITVTTEAVKSVSTKFSLVSYSLVKNKGFVINRFI